MSDHVNQLLQAYHDGELPEWQKAEVEAHLAACKACREELQGLQKLSALLRSAPAAEELTAPQDFTAQVQGKLARRPQQPAWRNNLRLGWQLAPLGMMLVLVFMQTTTLVNNLIVSIGLLGGDHLGDKLALLQSSMYGRLPISFPKVGLGQVVGLPWQGIGLGALLGFDVTFNLTLPAMISLLAVSWLAGWYVAQQQKKDKEETK